jgi:hypothetical protein
MTPLVGLLLAASIDGGAALRHASALAALGPHSWGSTRNEAAALYVAAQMRASGLAEVELQRFERHGIQGTNVVGTLRGPGEELLLVGAHHDTAPGAPGAYDDGGGVGVLLELARVLAAEPSRTRSIVFVSFDGEEAWATGKGTTAGSRAFLERLGPRARSLVAAFVIEMCGFKGGTPALHPVAYADPRTPGATVVAPGWLVRAALSGSRAAGAPLALGDPYLSWLYQPAVRSFRVRLYGDDVSFLQAGRPALFASDSSFSAFYADYHKPTDVADRLDADALARMAQGALGVVHALDRAPRGAVEEPHWFAALGAVVDWPWLLGAGALSALPGLWAAYGAGALPFAARLLQAAGFGVLLWSHPVPALWVFLAPNLLLPFARRWWAVLLALAPLAALVGIGAAAWWRGAVNGVWLAPWQVALGILALVLAFVGRPGRPSVRRSPGRGKAGGSGKRSRR